MSSRCSLQLLIPEVATGRILIAWHRPSRTWTLPAGDLRLDEDMTAAAHRVATESVSIGVQVGWVADIAAEAEGVSVLIPGRHVTGRPTANGSYSQCLWAEDDDLARLLPPRRTRQVQRALRLRRPQTSRPPGDQPDDFNQQLLNGSHREHRSGQGHIPASPRPGPLSTGPFGSCAQRRGRARRQRRSQRLHLQRSNSTKHHQRHEHCGFTGADAEPDSHRLGGTQFDHIKPDLVGVRRP